MNVLLVDDDIEMLESMRRMTLALGADWQVAGLAEDGVEALELLQKTPVDILATDITMIDMDGLELIAQARQLCPALRCLLITCHEDFYYAQEGIQLGVDDYLVKYTLTDAKFQQAMLRTREKAEQARRQNDSLQDLSTEVYKNREHFRENVIRTILNTPAASTALVARAPLYGITLPQGAFTVTVAFLSHGTSNLSAEESALIRYAVMNVAQELLGWNTSFAFQWNDAVCFLLWDGSASTASARTKLKNQLEHVRHDFMQHFHTELYMIAGCRPVDFSGLKKELERLDSLRDRLFYSDAVLLEENICPPVTNQPIPDETLSELQELLFDLPGLRTAFARIYRELLAARPAPQEVRTFLDKFVTQIQVVSQYSDQWLAHTAIDGLTAEACYRQVEMLLDQLSETLWAQGSPPSKDVRYVVEYINSHLSEDINLELAAMLVHKNSSYFSRQFKKEVGLTFSDFVIQQRIRKATYLLENTKLPMDRIAEAIGIANSQYFSTFYKRETNRSPGDLRRQ